MLNGTWCSPEDRLALRSLPGHVRGALQTHTLPHWFGTSPTCSTDPLSLITDGWQHHPQNPRRRKARGNCLSGTASILNPLLKWLLYPRSVCVHLATREHFETNKAWAVCPGLRLNPAVLGVGGGAGGGGREHSLDALRHLATSGGSQMAFKADGCVLWSLVTCGSDNEVFWCADTLYSVTMVLCLWWHHLICTALPHLWKASIFTRVPVSLLLLFFSVRLNFSQRENIAWYWFQRTR